MVLFNLYDKITELANDFKNFILDNANNPLLWIGLFLAGLFIFKAVYYALNKNQ